MTHQINKAPYMGLFLFVRFQGEEPDGFDKIARSDFERTKFGPKGEPHG